MATASAAAGHASRPSLTLTRRIDAPPEKIYAAWTHPVKIARWFGPAQVKAGSVRADIDLRVGGRYRISFEAENGEYSQVDGVYREVTPNARITFSWAWHSTPERESQVTVLLQPDGGGPLLTLHHEQFFDEAARDGHARGWSALFDKLEKYLG